MTEQKNYDALVVGAGVIGLACAWRAARRGLAVCVLERDRPGAGASSVAAGMLAPVTEAEFGEEELLRLSLAAASGYPTFVEELQEASEMELEYRRTGALYVALDRDESEELRRLHAFRTSPGLDAEWLLPRHCRQLEPGLSTACAGGMSAPREAEVDPSGLLHALALALERAGGKIVCGARVSRALVRGERLVGLETADGRRYAAAHVVLAAGCWSGNADWLPEQARPRVRPVKGQILTLRGSAEEPLCERIVRTPRVYVVPRRDGRLVVGVTSEEVGFDARVTAGGVHELLREAYRVLPDVAELELLEARAGLRPGSPDNAPLIGLGPLEGLLLATGHYRNGILLAPVTADAIAAMLAGEEPDAEIAPFSPLRFCAEVAA